MSISLNGCYTLQGKGEKKTYETLPSQLRKSDHFDLKTVCPPHHHGQAERSTAGRERKQVRQRTGTHKAFGKGTVREAQGRFLCHTQPYGVIVRLFMSDSVARGHKQMPELQHA
eukprot:466454-Pelagomonas_calceolata.AAC.1